MRGKRGFSVIELLIAVGIIGILAAIAINNYYNALHRTKQKRTMADIRGIAVAWEARAVDARQYNAAGAGFALPATPLTYADLKMMLSPTYIGNLPANDGWGNALEFSLDKPVGGAAAAEYSIRSPGRDARYQSSYAVGPTTDFDCDIVYSNGGFVVWPEGTQQK